MADKTKEEKQLENRAEPKPLASSDAKTTVAPTAQERQIVESERTNQSSGSIAELALKTRGLTKEQIARQLAAQGDSVSIDYGNGKEASRKNGLTEKDLDDKSNITLKPYELTPTVIKAGLDYNQEEPTFSQKLLKFASSAQTRLLAPEAREAYFQGLIDKTIGIGEGLNEAKNEIKTGVSHAGQKAWTALTDGSVANFLAKPNAINEPLFTTIGNCLDVMAKDPNAVNNLLTLMGMEFQAANDRYTNMSPHDRGVQDGKAMFFFINPAGSTEGAELAMTIAAPAATKLDAALVDGIHKSVQAAQELAATAPELAEQSKNMILDYVRRLRLTPQELQAAGIPQGWMKEQPLFHDNVYAMSDGKSAIRGDVDPYEPLNPMTGRRKSYITADGDLTPADPKGLFKGSPVDIVHHLCGSFFKHHKAFSPFTSFSETGEYLAKYGDKYRISVDLAKLGEAIAIGEITGVQIIKHDEVLRMIENSPCAAFSKMKAMRHAVADKEILIRGVVPKRFLTVEELK